MHADGRIVDLPERSRAERLREERQSNPVDAAVADLAFALDQLPAERQWKDKIDFRRIGAFGHSLGGGASLDIAKADSRVKAVAALDGGYPAGIAKPLLYLHAAGNHLRQEIIADLGQPAFLETARPGYDLWIEGAAHSFCTDHFVLPYSPRTVDRAGTIEPMRGLAITREFVRAFFDQELKGKETGVSIGPSPKFPEVFVLHDPR